jgi:hypothetical protein
VPIWHMMVRAEAKSRGLQGVRSGLGNAPEPLPKERGSGIGVARKYFTQ